jgi:hypothetical protein
VSIHGRSQKTTKSIPELVFSASEKVEPEWGKVSYVTKRFQVGRTLVFRQIANGTWKSVLLRDKGKKSGLRLIHVPSVSAHLSRLAEQQSTPLAKGGSSEGSS